MKKNGNDPNGFKSLYLPILKPFMTSFRYRYLLLGVTVLFFLRHASMAQGIQHDARMHEAHREALMHKMAGGVAVVRGADEEPGAYHSRFLQNSDFYYLTGYQEPGAAMVLLPGRQEEFILFVQPRVPNHVLWNGKRYGLDEAVSVYAADKAYPMDQFALMLRTYLSDAERVYCDVGDRALMEVLWPVVRSTAPTAAVLDILPLIEDLRITKNQAELKRMQKAIDITCTAHRGVMQQVRPGMYEYEVEGLIEYVYRQNGSIVPAFTSIVASGPNALVLHYTHNDRMIEQGDLLLLDIGADFGHYAADVTRTLPVSGKFTKIQKDIYTIVLEAQQKAIESIRPGVGIDVPGTIITETLGKGLNRIGLVSDPEHAWQVKVWQMHGTSHWLGLDVHDAGPYSFGEPNGAVFHPGMVLTVEPGVYINPYVADHLGDFFPQIAEEERAEFIRYIGPALSKYRNIGIRIEDNVLVTASGHTVLSISAPKSMAAIEKLMAGGSREGE
jgi:Xaa-Pro aminopeptidase